MVDGLAAITLLIYWFVFGIVLKNGYPHFVDLPLRRHSVWNFFQTGVQTATGVIVERAGIVKKVAFPREILASRRSARSLLLLLQAIVLVVFMVVLASVPALAFCWLLVLAMAARCVFASAFGILLSALNVYCATCSTSSRWS